MRADVSKINPNPFTTRPEIEGTFVITGAGMAGSVSATLEVTIPDVEVSGDVSVRVNSGTIDAVVGAVKGAKRTAPDRHLLPPESDGFYVATLTRS